jgi:hypothetical protein
MHDTENKAVKTQETHVSRIYAPKEAPKGFSTIQVAKYYRSIGIFQLERWDGDSGAWVDEDGGIGVPDSVARSRSDRERQRAFVGARSKNG